MKELYKEGGLPFSENSRPQARNAHDDLLAAILSLYKRYPFIDAVALNKFIFGPRLEGFKASCFRRTAIISVHPAKSISADMELSII